MNIKPILLILLCFQLFGTAIATEIKYTIIDDETNTCNHIKWVQLSDSQENNKIHIKTSIPVNECRFFGMDEDLPIYKVSSRSISTQDKFKWWDFDKLYVQRRVHIQFDNKLLYEVIFEGKVQASCYFQKQNLSKSLRKEGQNEL